MFQVDIGALANIVIQTGAVLGALLFIINRVGARVQKYIETVIINKLGTRLDEVADQLGPNGGESLHDYAKTSAVKVQELIDAVNAVDRRDIEHTAAMGIRIHEIAGRVDRLEGRIDKHINYDHK